jgi:hypothetical protein
MVAPAFTGAGMDGPVVVLPSYTEAGGATEAGLRAAGLGALMLA